MNKNYIIYLFLYEIDLMANSHTSPWKNPLTEKVYTYM